MPYEITKQGRCWQVINSDTGMVHAKCTTKTKAEAQMRLLYGIETGSLKPRKTKNLDLKKRKMNPWIEHVKRVAKEKGITYPKALKIASATYKKTSGKKK